MFADDDGFINNPKSIVRQIRASNDDMNVLIAKKYILMFESGIIVIKDWKVHNYIQKDRYKETQYIEEKKQLFLTKDKAYTQDLCEAKYTAFGDKIDNVYKMDTQDRLELGKYSIGNRRKDTGAQACVHADDILYYQVVEANNAGAYLFISNNQVKDLFEKLTEDELSNYLSKMSALIQEDFTFHCSHYEFILSIRNKERKVKNE